MSKFIYNYDRSVPSSTAMIDSSVVLQEHPNDGGPVSYMAFSNLKNLKHDLEEIMMMLNYCDDLPQWVDQAISEAADRIHKTKKYIYGRKDV